MRYLYALVGIFLLLAASATAGSFKAQMDVDTYVDENNANQSFSDGDLLWATSDSGKEKQTYLSFINLFGSQSIFKPEQAKSATLTLDAAKVDKPGKITAYFLHGATFGTMTWYDKLDYDSSVSDSVNIDKEGSYTIDVTNIVQKAVEVCTEGCPYSIVLVADNGASVGFTSSEASDQKKPILEYTNAD
ncbi:Uncharacterised protein [uncultured archaeon]|nr:Uncharacterised protein [uncultured archaeon]